MRPQYDITDLTILAGSDILYSLHREYNEQAGTFDYVLHASAPLTGHVDIIMEQELGRILAQCWKQSDAGSFLGRHNMEWIIMCLESGGTI